MHLSQRPLRIALIRHGESEANLDKSIFERVPDHAIPLTQHGRDQSAAAGLRLRELFENEPVRVYVSPYLRTLQTLEAPRSRRPDRDRQRGTAAARAGLGQLPGHRGHRPAEQAARLVRSFLLPVHRR